MTKQRRRVHTPALCYSYTMWQDIVIASVNWVFLIALLPTVFHKTQKPTLATGLLTGTGLAVLAATFASLHLWLSVIGAGASAAVWLLIAWQRYRLNLQIETEARDKKY